MHNISIIIFLFKDYFKKLNISILLDGWHYYLKDNSQFNIKDVNIIGTKR